MDSCKLKKGDKYIMEKFKVKLKEIELEIPRDKVQELVEYLEMDEIVDSMTDKKQIDSLIERLCMDYPEKIAQLLSDFFNCKSDASILKATQQEELERRYQEYLTNRYKL